MRERDTRLREDSAPQIRFFFLYSIWRRREVTRLTLTSEEDERERQKILSKSHLNHPVPSFSRAASSPL